MRSRRSVWTFSVWLYSMPSPGTVRVNLNAPVVINLHNSRGVQCVSADCDGGFYRLAENGEWESAC